ncbi:MAG: deoxyribonuclease V [Saprospiraceae bacterium]
MEEGMYSGNNDFLPYYLQQNEMSKKVIKEDNLPEEINCIGGVDVAYNELKQKMIGAIVVLNSKTFEIMEEAYHEMNITFPYVPGLFSFREIPPLIEAYNKLKAKPEIIICDGHGIAHPKKIGMATHLGIELNIPTIGCAKNRLVGIWQKEKLGTKRGSMVSLNWDGEEVGKVLRTQDKIKPVFVSIGHMISLESATSWVLKLCDKYRLPETTRISDRLVNRLMKDRTEIKFLDKDKE